MKKKEIEKLVSLGFLESNDLCSIYGQEVIDKFLSLLINKLISSNFKHYEKDFIKEGIQGNYYRINSHYLELSKWGDNLNNEALDLEYFFSKFLKDTLGVALIEGYRYQGKYKYYLGYIYFNDLIRMFEIKQNAKIVYLKFDLFNIFYSIFNEKSYLSYLIAPYVSIIPLHQNKSGVLSYASKVQENLNFKSYIDEGNLSPLEKTKVSINKRVPLKIYLGPKEYKHQKVILEFNNQKIEISFEELNRVNDYLIQSLKDKYNSSLKEIYLFEKEKIDLENLKIINKVNLCENCKISGYKKFLIPFNRVNKTHKCLVCQNECNNIILIKKA